MLTFFRRGLMAKLMLGVLFLTLVAMVITGFGTGGGGLGDLGGLRAGTVASVGGEKITSDRLREACAARKAAWLNGLVGSLQKVLVERDGRGHAENFAPIKITCHSLESGNPAKLGDLHSGGLDPRFRGDDEETLVGRIVAADITALDGDTLLAEAV